MRLIALLIFSVVASTMSFAAPPLDVQRFHLDEQIEKEVGYSQALRVGDLLYVSGSVGKGEMVAAIRQAYDTLAKTLSAHGLSF